MERKLLFTSPRRGARVSGKKAAQKSCEMRRDIICSSQCGAIQKLNLAGGCLLC